MATDDRIRQPAPRPIDEDAANAIESGCKRGPTRTGDRSAVEKDERWPVSHLLHPHAPARGERHESLERSHPDVLPKHSFGLDVRLDNFAMGEVASRD